MKELINIQQKLKAPKGQRNTFGNYNYRSAEDILEAVKPLLAENNCVLTISDELVHLGERYYIKATATLESDTKRVFVSAYAREAESKKGMDESQVTGTASSYARKYALNGLFCIDDTKDADTDEYVKRTKAPEVELATEPQKKTIHDLCVMYGVDQKDLARKAGWEKGPLTADQYAKCMVLLKEIADEDEHHNG